MVKILRPLNHVLRGLSEAWLVLFVAAAWVGSGNMVVQAQQYYVTVQPTVICQTPSSGTPTVTTTPGTSCAPFNSLSSPTGTPGSSTNPIGFFDTASKTDITWKIWNQSGVNIAWVLPVQYYNNTNFQSITDIKCYTPPIPQPPAAPTPDPNCTTPYVLQSQQFLALSQQHGITQGIAPIPPVYPNPRVLNMFFGNKLVPPVGLSGTLYGFSGIGWNGMYIAAPTFSSGRSVAPQIDVLAHEIGHNLGLDHTDAYNYNEEAPALDLMTAGSSRTVPTTTAKALSQLGTGDGNGTADQLSNSSTPNYPGTSYQQSEVSGVYGTNGFLNPAPLATTTVVDPPGSDLVTFTTAGAVYSVPLPSGWPTNVTLTGVTITLGSGVTFDPVHTVKFTNDASYVKSYFYDTGHSGDANCPVGGTQCLVITLTGLPGPSSAYGNLIFTQGILKSPPPAPPGTTLLSQMATAGVYATYAFSDGLVSTSQMTPAGQLNSQISTSAIRPTQIIPAVFNTFQSRVNNPPGPCSKGVDLNVVPANERFSASGQNYNGCVDAYLAGARDGDPRLEAGQSGSPQIASCTPAGALSVLLQNPNVTAYVTNGAWQSSSKGVQVVPIEPASGTPASIATPNVVNSCSSNSTTGQTVCAANNTDVYLLSGTSLTGTLTSSSNGSTGFTGGSCQNCGVAINQVTNEAVIAMGLASSPSTSGLQFLNLTTNQFTPTVNAANQVSEGVLWDPGRNLILSPSEDGFYDLFDTSSMAMTPELPNPVYTLPGSTNMYGATELDSAAEDCSTGIALATNEFSKSLYLADLSQIMRGANSWTAPQQFVSFPEFQLPSGSAPVAGIAVAPGSHLAVVSGEFGGSQFMVAKLPTATYPNTPPDVVDYAVASLPNTPNNQTWAHGLDPHPVTAYVSPNDRNAYAVMANIGASYLAVVDMAALLAAPRAEGSNNVDPSYDLICNGVVRYIPTQSGLPASSCGG